MSTKVHTEQNRTCFEDFADDPQCIMEINIPPHSASAEALDCLVEGAPTHPIKKCPSSREINQVSPFRQAVKGYVRNKLSKKVGSSQILSGIIGKSSLERIVKKLEDGHAHGHAREAAAAPQITVNDEILKDDTHQPTHSANQELKSVVENVVPSVDEAIECFEGLSEFDKVSMDAMTVTSISLPASPAHRNPDDVPNSETTRHHSLIADDRLSLLLGPGGGSLQNLTFDSSSDTNLDEDSIELSEISKGTHRVGSPISSCSSIDLSIAPNAYSGFISDEQRKDEEDKEKDPSLQKRLSRAWLPVKRAVWSVPASHFMLVVAIILHNCWFVPSFVLYVFDSIVVAFVLGSLLLSVPLMAGSSSPSSSLLNRDPAHGVYVDTSTTKKILKGSAKILRGPYNPEKKIQTSTDEVDLTLEGELLRITLANSEDCTEEVHDLRGGKVSLLPKGLPKKRIFSKKYPICIRLFPVSENSLLESDKKDMSCCDFVCLRAHEDGLLELDQEGKALYIFPVTHREKESWFWALTNACNSKCDDSDETMGPDLPADPQSSTDTPTLSFDRYLSDLLAGYQFSSNEPDRCSVEVLNFLLGRLSYDFLTQDKWAEEVKSRIQRRLDKIDLPSFLDRLCVSEVTVGNTIPKFLTVGKVECRSSGLWLDCEVSYAGSFRMTLNTRLRMNGPDSNDPTEDDSIKAQGTLGRIERWVNNRRFQSVAQSRFVKRYVGDVNNMPLTLAVHVKNLEGCLALNVPHAPADRIWYGFKGEPNLSLDVSPKVGALRIHLSPLLQVIEKKLLLAFQKAVVMPNMDDVIIPTMYSPVYDT